MALTRCTAPKSACLLGTANSGYMRDPYPYRLRGEYAANGR